MYSAKKALSALAACALAVPVFASSAFAAPTPVTADDSQPTVTVTKQDILAKLAASRNGSDELINVVVLLDKQPASPTESGEKSNIASQNELIKAWQEKYDLTIKRQFGYLVNGFSATLPANQIAQLQAEDGVASVKKERLYETTEYSARDLHGVPAAYEHYGVDGTGTVVAIIDTGIDIKHQDMRLDSGVCANSKLKPDTAHGFTCKVPYGYNYADENYNVLDTTSSMHGMHVAGIVGANASPDDQPLPFSEGNRIDGAAPNAQLLAMKVFSNDGSGGAYDADIIAAIEDSVKLGADVMNLSLGSPNGQKVESDGAYRAIEAAREQGVFVVISAGNEGLNFSQTAETDDIFGRLDDGTVGSPGTQANAFTVASIDNVTQVVTNAYYKDTDDTEQTFTFNPQIGEPDGQWHPIVDKGFGFAEDYTDGEDLSGKFVLVQRGTTDFATKMGLANDHGAAGFILYNNAGEEYVNMAGVENFTFFAATLYQSTGEDIKAAIAAHGGEGQIRFSSDQSVEPYETGLQPSSFTSWGSTPTLDFEPDIAGIGGAVYSTLNDNSYGVKSGTSMASPNIAGLSALLIEDYANTYPDLSRAELLTLIETSFMNTAAIPANEEGVPYAPRQIGAGLGRVDLALDNNVFANSTYAGVTAASVALREIDGPVSFTVDLTNRGTADVSYTIGDQQVVNETNAEFDYTTTFVSDETLTADTATVTVPAGGTASVTFTLTPDTSVNHWIEGWAKFTSTTDGEPSITVPYLGFVGDWNAEPIVQEPGEPWSAGVNETTTGLYTSWGGEALPVNILSTFYGPDYPDLALSPNGDGDDDVVIPNLLLMRNAAESQYSVYKVNPDGSEELVRNLGGEQNLYRTTAIDFLATSDDLGWFASAYPFDGLVYDPQQADYVPVPDGEYIYRVQTRLGEAYDWQTVDLPFTVDNTAPVINFVSYQDDVLTFTIDENNPLIFPPTVTTNDDVELDAVPVEGDPFSFTVELPADTDYVTVVATDVGQTLGVGTFVVTDGTLVVSDADELDGGVVTPQSYPVNDDELTVSGYVSADIAEVAVNGETVAVSAGRFTTTVPLTEGDNTIVVTATNGLGEQVAQTTIVPYYDATAPIVTITNTTVDGTVPVNADGTVTVEGTVVDERPGATPTATIVVGDYTADVTVNADGTFSHTFTPTTDDYLVTITASDYPAVGNVGSASALVAGTKAPVAYTEPVFSNMECQTGFAACFPQGNPAYYDADTGLFTVVGVDGQNAAKIVLTPTGRAGEDGKIVDSEPIEIYPAKDGTFTAQIPLGTGINDFRIEIWDLEYNKVLDRSLKVYFDFNAPTLTIEEPTLLGGTLYTNTPEVTLSGSAADDGWGYTFLLNNSAVLDLFSNSGFGPESNEREFATKIVVADGDQLLLQIYDSMGNQLIGVIPVVLDEIAPEITFKTATTEQTNYFGETSQSTDTVTVTATDKNIGSLVVTATGTNGQVFEQTVQAPFASADVTVISDELTDARDLVDDPATGGVTQATPSASTTATDDVTGSTESVATETPIIDDVTGTATVPATDTLTIEVPLASLPESDYTIQATATDLAGNTSGNAETARVDLLPVVEGPDDLTLSIDRELLGDQDALLAQVLENYSITDDGDTATLNVQENTVITEEGGQVLVVATQTNGLRNAKPVAVNIVLNERTLTATDADATVTATSTFRSDDTLTVTTTVEGNSSFFHIANSPEFAALESVITVPGVEGAKVYQIFTDGHREPVAAIWADGVFTFVASSKGTYEVESPAPVVDPKPLEPGLPGQPGAPGSGSGSGTVEPPVTGLIGVGAQETSTTPADSSSTPEALSKTGASTSLGSVIASFVLVAGGLALTLRMRRVF